MITDLLADLAVSAGVFVLCWGLYLSAQVIAAKAGLIAGVDRSTVLLAVAMAAVGGAISWFCLGHVYSSPGVHLLASIAAPFAFLGYCGIYVLLVPVTIDRSISLAMLMALEKSQYKGLKRSELQSEVPFDRIFQKRIREMELSGSIDLTDQLKITRRGLRIIAFYRFLAQVLRVKFQ